MGEIYTVILERVSGHWKPNYNVYIEDVNNKNQLKFICYNKHSSESRLPEIDLVPRDKVRDVFSDFEILFLEDLKGLLSGELFYENRQQATHLAS